MIQTLQLPAPAKLNLFLHVLGRRLDGYHDLQTIFQFVDYCDYLTFYHRNDDEIKLTPDFLHLPASKNLIVKAALLLKKESGTSHGVDITLDKRLPMGGGLGGGSSDAATTLLALNLMWDLQYSMNELAELGQTLGADVPVFVHGYAAWGEGVGERLTPMLLPEPWYVLLIPPCHVDTAKLFQDSRLTRDSVPLTIDQYQPGMGRNDFEALVCMDYPAVSQALDWLSQFSKARMSGSGSVVFSGFDTEREASRIAADAPGNCVCVVVKGMNQSPLHAALEKYWGVAKR